ncbi:hypothetical protein F5Y13DRAFT_198872 [Hypoxylon sp. FL1857]|nr:hypothetical protein F5Y13DRAFT_198872 [Hypoxylon sp. FL1857]
MAASLAQLGVQYMPSTGSCLLDMASAPLGLFDSCGSIHIRVLENQHNIDVHSNMICIKPSKPAMSQDTSPYHEQYINPTASSPTGAPQASPKQQQKNPPSMEGPGSPAQGPSSGSGRPNMPNDHHQVPSSTMETRVRPAHSSSCTSTMLSTFTSIITHLQSSYLGHSPTSSPSATSHGFSTSIIPTSSNPPQQPDIHIPAPPAPAAPTPPPLPQRPAVPQPPSPPPAPPAPPRPEVRPTQPNPAPAYCGNSYIKMDVTTIDDLDPHDLDLYLNLLGLIGIGLDLDHGIDGLLDGLLGGAVDDDDTRAVRQELEHSYRVRCGISDSDWMQGAEGADRRERIATAPDQTGCLQQCEKEAIGRARDKEVKECLGAAWHRRLPRDNCRYWTGGRDEFLPVDGLRSDGDGEWDLVYL